MEDNFELDMMEKIDNKIKLTESEIEELVWGFSIDTKYGENRRWSRSVQSIIDLNGRYFAIDWEEGLTELQDNAFYEQPYEVVKTEKTIVVTEWVKKDFENRKDDLL